MNTSKTGSRAPVPVRNLHVLLNSSRVSSFFRRVLDSFKNDVFLWNLKLKLIVVKWTHQKQDQGHQSQSGNSRFSYPPAEFHHSSGGLLIASNKLFLIKTKFIRRLSLKFVKILRTFWMLKLSLFFAILLKPWNGGSKHIFWQKD